MGLIIAFTGAHPILVSLSMMIFLRGLGEFLTRGGDISGFPISLVRSATARSRDPRAAAHLDARPSRSGTCCCRAPGSASLTYMIGSNIEAARYSGINTKRALSLIYALSGAMCALAGVIMLARFNSVRVGHGDPIC